MKTKIKVVLTSEKEKVTAKDLKSICGLRKNGARPTSYKVSIKGEFNPLQYHKLMIWMERLRN